MVSGPIRRVSIYHYLAGRQQRDSGDFSTQPSPMILTALNVYTVKLLIANLLNAILLNLLDIINSVMYSAKKSSRNRNIEIGIGMERNRNRGGMTGI